MSAVAELSKPDTAVLFTAARADLRLVKKKRRPVRGPDGEVVDETPGECFKFVHGTYRVLEDGAPLENGETLDREAALTWLRKHKLYGNMHEGFTEIQQAAPAVSQEELAALMEATLQAAAMDDRALVALIEAEEQGWNREALLAPAREALERVQSVAAAAAPAPKRAAK
jgi:hypothetical protein